MQKSNVTGINRDTTTHKLLVSGLVHNLLFRGVLLFQGKLPRKEI